MSQLKYLSNLDYLIVQSDITANSALELMVCCRVESAIVFMGEQFIGYLQRHRCATFSYEDPVGFQISDVFSCSEIGYGYVDFARLPQDNMDILLTTHPYAIPVFKGGVFQGVASRESLLNYFGSQVNHKFKAIEFVQTLIDKY